MSHLTKVKTKLNDAKKLKRALIWLGFKIEENKKINSLNEVPVCDFVITNVGHWNIGFYKTEQGMYEIVGDSVSWGPMKKFERLKVALKNSKNNDDCRNIFAGIVAQAAAVTTAIIEAENLGHTIVVSDPDKDGIIHARVETASA